MADDTPRADGASADTSEPSEPAVTDGVSTSADDRSTDSDAPSGETGDSDAPSGETGDSDAPSGETGDSDPRRVVVPTHVYKRVTVFSTLFAVVMVVAGFLLLDSATRRATLELSEVNPVLALAGLGCIVLGAVTYAFSTRFQAEGMGNAKEESDETSNNG